jgi:uncharacterized alkaline shock family protein YloU
MGTEKTRPEQSNLRVIDIGANGQDQGGHVHITNNVLGAIVRRYALSVDGVVRFPSQGIMDSLADILSKRNYERNIVIEPADENDDGTEITLSLILRFGVSVPDVARAVQKIVAEKVEEMTGCPVSCVNVNVVDLEEVEENDEVVEATDLGLSTTSQS